MTTLIAAPLVTASVSPQEPAKPPAHRARRGINSFQLMRDGDRWRVVTIYWEPEPPGHEIPAQYLPRK